MNTLFPIFLKLKNQLCTVVGGGQIAARKISGLLECQTTVRVIASAALPVLHQLSREQKIELHERAYQPGDIQDSLLVVAATNDDRLNNQIAQECAQQRILCNVVDTPDLCDFYYGSVYTCGELKIAISTNGAAPAFGKKIKAELAERYPETLRPYLRYLQKMREIAKEKIASTAQRQQILETIVQDAEFFAQAQRPEFQDAVDALDYTKELDAWLAKEES
ncbi:MAG: bifunctional precorrin-2 dehydrogenase/sirohydrochlorin ferrochelatase [Candidatus Vecturithrix sp.]|jgi:precorrin-2 dehydrogenase/sirohydrochlorin ferrochelatase|nr:bifunctional precorrin-2 dehydrogenase/sirohydrochlorin ferrochelatase [Candidatus Vecturithrix sp.]